MGESRHLEPAKWPAAAPQIWPVARLRPYERNARTHSPAQVDQIVASIKRWGFTNPVLAQPDGTIIAGHGRVMAAQKMGLAEVPVMVADGWSPEETRAYVLADNKIALNAGWDEALLAAEIGALRDMDFPVDLLGFDEKELAAINAAVADNPGDPDDVPEPQAVAVSKPGDMWALGDHRILCGDCTKAESWNRLQVSKTGSIAFTSPPYGVGDAAKLRDRYIPGKASRESFYTHHDDDPSTWPRLMMDWTTLAVKNCATVLCNVQMLANNKRALLSWAMEFSDHIVDVAVWDKGHGAPQMQPNVLNNAFEWMFILSAKQDASRAVPLANFHGTLGNVIRVAREKNEFADVHRAAMPVGLAQWAVDLCSDATTIVDPFGGTGTTLIAAHMKNINAALVEIDPIYVDVAIRRWEKFTGDKARHAETGELFP